MGALFRGLLGLAFLGFYGANAWAESPAAPSPPAPPVTAASELTAASANFWQEWTETKTGADFTGLTSAIDCNCEKKTPAGVADISPKDVKAQAVAPPNKPKPVVDVAITRPDEAAKLLSESTGAATDSVSRAALATVIDMRMSPEVREAAIEQVVPESRTQVEEFRANLSTGIPGLPGIYLGDTAQSSAWSGGTSGGGGESYGGGSYDGGRASAPSGYTPVSGGSMGCPSR